MNRLRPTRFVAISCLLGLSFQAGCVALNLPSERHHDPGDRGGLLGHWHSPHAATTDAGVGVPVDMGPNTAACSFDGGPLDCHSGYEGDDFGSQAPPEPIVPWPRFHPVPTRPVFGSPFAAQTDGP